MKKFLMVLMITLLSSVSFSQSYVFKKCFTQIPGLSPTMVKMSGEVNIKDTTIQFIQNGVISETPIEYLTKSEDTKQFIHKGEQFDIRYSFARDKDQYILVMEVKDKFTSNISQMMYYLTKK